MKKMMTAVVVVVFILFANQGFAQNKVGLHLSLDFPMGDFSNISSTGFGFAGTYEYMVMPQLGLTGSIGYYHFGSKSINEGFVSVETSTNIVPVVVGGRYYFTQGELMPYGGAELGLYFASASATINYSGYNFLFKSSTVNSVQNVAASSDNSSSSTNFGFAPFVGVRYAISPNISLDGNIKFTIVTTSGSSTSYFGINAGAFYAF